MLVMMVGMLWMAVQAGWKGKRVARHLFQVATPLVV